MAKGSGSALRCPLLAVSSPELPWVPEAGETENGSREVPEARNRLGGCDD